MFRTIEEAKAFLQDRDDRRKYDRSHFDAFLEYQKFNFKVPAIHITGTNGKTTTAKMLANIYQLAGYKTGLFTSPYLSDENEMWQINNKFISDQELLSFINRYAVDFLRFDLTAFEMETFIAFIYFAESKVDIAIIEVGMGGKTDATNVFIPILSIITNVSLEHSSFLGPTLKDIATAKAGIIKPIVPVLLGGEMLPELIPTIKEVAKKNGSPVFIGTMPHNIRYTKENAVFDFDECFNDIKMQNPAQIYVFNAVNAISACRILQSRFPLRNEHMRQGIEMTTLPARMEIVHYSPLVFIDGAHNPQAMEILVETLKELGIFAPTIIFSAFRDKDVAAEFDLLKEIDANIILTHFDHPRTRDKDEYPHNNFPYIENPITAIKQSLKAVEKNEVIVITGSLGFAGYISFLWKEGVFP
ncbi:MAG: bifunctional folylpolyglutamate synthase/dihydrofolate synthase [Bacilli bacterium]|jgi:dihydrofolate synthase/folylpolyglutamate synthase